MSECPIHSWICLRKNRSAEVMLLPYGANHESEYEEDCPVYTPLQIPVRYNPTAMAFRFHGSIHSRSGDNQARSAAAFRTVPFGDAADSF